MANPEGSPTSTPGESTTQTLDKLPAFGEIYNGQVVDINFIQTGYESDLDLQLSESSFSIGLDSEE
jgi:hypothetical protein